MNAQLKNTVKVNNIKRTLKETSNCITIIYKIINTNTVSNIKRVLKKIANKTVL